MNFFIVVVIVSLIFLLLATIYLVWLNRSDKIYGQILAAVTLAVLATLLSTYFSLKETKEEAVFVTSVAAFVAKEGELIWLIAPDKKTKFSVLNDKLFGFSNPSRAINDKVIYKIKPPTNTQESHPYYAELIQYKILDDIFQAQITTYWSEPTELENNVFIGKSRIYTPYKLTDENLISNDKLYEMISPNRFSDSDSEEFKWKNSSHPFPKDATITLKNIPEQSSYSIFIEKPNFFQIEINVQPYVSSGNKGLPEDSGISLDEARNYKTYNYLVTMKAVFIKWSSENWQTAEYKEWTKRLFSFIQKSLDYATVKE